MTCGRKNVYQVLKYVDDDLFSFFLASKPSEKSANPNSDNKPINPDNTEKNDQTIETKKKDQVNESDKKKDPPKKKDEQNQDEDLNDEEGANDKEKPKNEEKKFVFRYKSKMFGLNDSKDNANNKKKKTNESSKNEDDDKKKEESSEKNKNQGSAGGPKPGPNPGSDMNWKTVLWVALPSLLFVKIFFDYQADANMLNYTVYRIYLTNILFSNFFFYLH